MKNLSIILVVFILFSCGEANKKEHNSVSTSENKTLETAKTEIKKTNNNKVLCKINGKDWEYTTSDGMVSRNSSTQVRTATIGFKKQLEKGYESIQLEYDVDKNVLNNVWVQLKRPTKDGKMITAFYTQYGDKIDQDPKASLSGTVSLNEDSRKASGTAEITISNDYEQDQLANSEDLLITVTDLNFSGINYSDTDDLKKLIKK
ncbi:hypothetical protein [Yeosuana sp.]|uniref:hypothetical protein n=1 Tax=Yeosuana sp. TaxID=2529388 RepID=UPI0040550E1D|tara:strand:+ start:3551 stop:4162 length:612 start_codon:yes stop_codon:yes gene_type:complete